MSVESPDVAILHDQFRTLGGAERVGIEMARALDAPIYAARVDDGIVPSDVDAVELFSGLAARAMRSHHHIQDLAQMYGWQHRPEIYDYDIVLMNKTNPMWYVPREEQTVLAYLHSTPRGFYDQFDVQGGGVSTVLYTLMRTLFNGNRTRPDAIACNSEIVQRRASLYWDRQDRIQALHPPVSIDSLGPQHRENGDYYVTVGRLARNKRVKGIVQAFQGTDRELVIAGDGVQRQELEEMADGHQNITLYGYVDEETKAQLLSGAKAFVMNAECEDFGMTPIESLASGTPVLGVDEGFTRYQIEDGVTGLLYNRGDLLQSVNRFESDGVVASDSELVESVAGFGRDRFRRELVEWVHDTHERTEIVPDWPERQQPQATALLRDGGNDAD